MSGPSARAIVLVSPNNIKYLHTCNYSYERDPLVGVKYFEERRRIYLNLGTSKSPFKTSRFKVKDVHGVLHIPKSTLSSVSCTVSGVVALYMRLHPLRCSQLYQMCLMQSLETSCINPVQDGDGT